jgi:hypothetical protein
VTEVVRDALNDAGAGQRAGELDVRKHHKQNGDAAQAVERTKMPSEYCVGRLVGHG